MNILHTETLKGWGGQQNRILMESVGLKRRGRRVLIACQRGSVLARRAREAGITVYELNFRGRNHLTLIPGLMKIIRQEHIDIVSTHSSIDSWAGGVAAKLTGRRLVRFRHNIYPVGRGPMVKFIYSIPDRIITISNTVAEVLMSSGINCGRMHTIYSAADSRLFSPETEDLRKELGIPSGTLVIGNSSTFSDAKGQEYLLRAFHLIHRQVPCLLLFAGSLEEPFRSRYLSHVEEGLRDRVIFLDHRDDIPQVLKTLDVFVFPSVLEGLGTALIEAMAMGRAAAVSDIPTFREFISDRTNGLVFKTADPEDLAEKVIALLKDEQLRERLGRSARETAADKFTYDKMIDFTEAQYREVLDAV